MEDNKEVSSSESFISPNKVGSQSPWMISTIVLGVVALVLLAIVVGGKLTGNVVSEQGIEASLVSFVKAQGGNLTVTSIAKESGMYKVNVSVDGQDIPVFVSLDGKYLIPSTIPLSSDNSNVAPSSADTQQPVQKDIPKSAKPVVEAFVMSYCPYGTQIEKGLLPVVALLKDKIDFKVRWVSYAMHGQKEVNENTVQYCIEKEQSTKYLSYLQCFLNASNSASCLTSTGIDQTKLNSCVSATDKAYKITELFNDKSTWLNGNYPQYNVDKEDNTKYGVQGSPTLVINGIEASSARSPAALLATICSSFTTAPSECSQTLSSDSPSAGFGYGSSSADSSAATCG